MRKSSLFFLYILFQTLLLGGLFTLASHRQKIDEASLQEKVNLVQKLGLTDLCLFTEASYTRHLSHLGFSSL
jgi:hypothetical protein